MTLDPVKIYHKPLAHYTLIQVINYSAIFLYSNLGFQRLCSIKGFPVFYRKGSSSASPPLVFFHGLGIGLPSYLPFISDLVINQPDRTCILLFSFFYLVVLFEMPSISMQLDDNHVLPKEYSTHVSECLEGLGLSKCVFAGHSIGTACVRWMDLFYPELVLGRVFIDPICFSLWTHHIAHNALYRNPKTLNECFIKYVGMSEAGIATFLHRYFVWYRF